MYEEHFGFRGLPFSANPVEWQFFESESSTALMPKVLHALQSAAGVAVVTGPEGVGKTVLLYQLQVALASQGQTIILPGTSLQSTEDLYHCIRHGVQTRDGQSISDAAGRWEVVEQLQQSVQFRGPVELLVDDAHLLPTVLFTEFQFLIEQHFSDQPLCRLLLAGSLALEETLAEPAKAGFAQRIRSYTFLQPLRPTESVEYLNCRLSHAGGALSDCFDADAVEIIVVAADGNPRCLNLLADESLVLACQNQQDRVTYDTVQTALNGLQHLPHVWNISVRDQSESGLDDTTTSYAGGQSSSDGVIEIGTAPQSVGVEPDDVELGRRAGVPTELVDCLELNVSSDESIVGTTDEIQSVDELPVLDDLAADSWPDELLETEFLAPLFDGPQIGERKENSNTGYQLAELEPVGDPSIEVDDDLELRLMHATDAADSEFVTVIESSRLTSEILPNFQLWQPAGSWDLDKSIIRYWAQLETHAGHPHDKSPVSDGSHDVSIPVRAYEINIPAIDEPVPVWPPQTFGIGAVRSIPETVMTTAPVGAAVADSGSTGMTTHAETKDGQQLTAINSEAESSPPEDAGEVVPLRITGRTDEFTESQDDAAESDGADDTSPVVEHMVTLPLTKQNGTGEYTSLVTKFGMPEPESDGFQCSEGNSNLSMEAIHRPVTASAPFPSGGGNAAEPESEDVVEDTGEDIQRLMRSRLISQAGRMLSNVDSVQQLRMAAGAENSAVFAEVHTPMSVAVCDEHAESAADEFKVLDPGVNGFHNLFTRLRRRYQ